MSADDRPVDTPPGTDLAARLRLLLPPLYEAREQPVRLVSMTSAALQYGPDGKVAWDTIWRSFCDLALAGGPPHRGTLLEPGDTQAIDAAPELYHSVQLEASRGVMLVTGLFAEPASDAGWIRMYCTSAGMASWLARAIVTENVSAQARGLSLFLPAGPRFRVEKEIKNVVTAVAKTCHYWLEHMELEQHWKIATLFRTMESESPLVVPGDAGQYLHVEARIRLGSAIHAVTGLVPSQHTYSGWLGLHCAKVDEAVTIVRLLVVSNVCSRREQDVVFVPVNLDSDRAGEIVLRAVSRAHSIALGGGGNQNVSK